MPIRCGVLAAILCCSASVQAADSIPVPGFTVHGSLGLDVYGWPFGVGLDGALWLDRGPWMAAAEVRWAGLRGQYDPTQYELVAGSLGAYGVQVGASLLRSGLTPFVLIGYERVGSYAWDGEGGAGGGRTEQNVNLEIGSRIAAATGEILIGIRAFFPFARSLAEAGPSGPPLPRAALATSVRF